MSYNLLYTYHFLVNGDMSASFTSRATDIRAQDNVGIQLMWTGNAVGTFDVQISVDHKQDSVGNVLEDGTWVSLPLNPAIAAAGASDSGTFDLNQLSAAYIRVVYTRTSGTGVIDGHIGAKGV